MSEYWLGIIDQFTESRNGTFVLGSSARPREWSNCEFYCLEISFAGGEQLILVKTMEDQSTLRRMGATSKLCCTEFSVAYGTITWDVEMTLEYATSSNIYDKSRDRKEMRARKIRSMDDILGVNFAAYGRVY